MSRGHLDDIEAALRSLKPAGNAEMHAAYIGGGQSKLEYLGLKVPQLDGLMKRGFEFTEGSETAVFKIWDYIWKTSPCYEAMSLPLAYYGHKKRWEQLPALFPKMKVWVSRIDNWAHSDGLSSLFARALEADRELVLPTLEAWSEAREPWKRRQSLVSLLYYSSARTKVLPFPILRDLVEKQLDHEHYYVQKGVGWTLREMGNVYPEKTLAYLTSRVTRISPHAFSAAAEKLSVGDRETLKALRKTARLRKA